MKKLLALLLLFGMVGCEKEPSLLEKCMETNINLFETTTTGDDLKIVFQPDLNIYIDYRYSLVDKSNKDWCFIDYVDRNECANLEAEIFFSKYGSNLFAESKDFYETVNVIEIKEAIKLSQGSNELEDIFHKELIKNTYEINAKLKCSEQGIY